MPKDGQKRPPTPSQRRLRRERASFHLPALAEVTEDKQQRLEPTTRGLGQARGEHPSSVFQGAFRGLGQARGEAPTSVYQRALGRNTRRVTSHPGPGKLPSVYEFEASRETGSAPPYHTRPSSRLGDRPTHVDPYAEIRPRRAQDIRDDELNELGAQNRRVIEQLQQARARNQLLEGQLLSKDKELLRLKQEVINLRANQEADGVQHGTRVTPDPNTPLFERARRTQTKPGYRTQLAPLDPALLVSLPRGTGTPQNTPRPPETQGLPLPSFEAQRRLAAMSLDRGRGSGSTRAKDKSKSRHRP